MTARPRTVKKLALAALTASLLVLLVVSVGDAKTTEWFFVNTTYYFHLVTLLCWGFVYLGGARSSGEAPHRVVANFAKENWQGLAITSAVTVVAVLAVDPALRVLSDEANLVGTSKNLFASKTATFTVSGKNYYGSYWDTDVAIDQRPTLFPFLVSLVHVARGYTYENVFLLNALVLWGFLFIAYRLGKSVAGELFGVVAALLVAAHPITLISARSGGFDLLAACLSLLVLKSSFDVLSDSSPRKLAIFWMNLCVFAGVRYETALFLPPAVALLLTFRTLTWRRLRPYAFVYALTPVFLLPRLWLALLRGSIPAQEPGTVAFSAHHVFGNVAEYFAPILPPFDFTAAHTPLLIALGVVGAGEWLLSLARRARAREWSDPSARFGLVLLAWVLLQALILFAYVWGRAQYPSAARLFIPVDTLFSFAAAWFLVRRVGRCFRSVPSLLAAAVLVMAVPVAAQHRSLNRLTQTRENARTWEFFERLNEKRILVVTDRPHHFTIMNYGAMSFGAARNDHYLFTAHARHLFHDVYVIQQIQLSTEQPFPQYVLWPDRKLETMLEFQNDADVLVRVSRLPR